METKHTYTLEVFEGPLDLLVHLIEKNKIDITDIPISLLFEQFMEYVESYREAEIENLSEFLLIASKLLYIKSRAIIKAGEEDEAMEELAAMIVDYKRYKEIAQQLGDKYKELGVRRVTKKADDIVFAQEIKRTYDTSALTNAIVGIQNMTKRKLPPPITAFTGIITKTTSSVGERVITILRRLFKRDKMYFSEIIESSKNRSEVISSFMAVLELSRKERIVFTESGNDIEIKIKGKHDEI